MKVSSRYGVCAAEVVMEMLTELLIDDDKREFDEVSSERRCV